MFDTFLARILNAAQLRKQTAIVCVIWSDRETENLKRNWRFPSFEFKRKFNCGEMTFLMRQKFANWLWEEILKCCLLAFLHFFLCPFSQRELCALWCLLFRSSGGNFSQFPIYTQSGTRVCEAREKFISHSVDIYSRRLSLSQRFSRSRFTYILNSNNIIQIAYGCLYEGKLEPFHIIKNARASLAV